MLRSKLHCDSDRDVHYAAMSTPSDIVVERLSRMMAKDVTLRSKVSGGAMRTEDRCVDIDVSIVREYFAGRSYIDKYLDARLYVPKGTDGKPVPYESFVTAHEMCACILACDMYSLNSDVCPSVGSAMFQALWHCIDSVRMTGPPAVKRWAVHAKGRSRAGFRASMGLSPPEEVRRSESTIRAAKDFTDACSPLVQSFEGVEIAKGAVFATGYDAIGGVVCTALRRRSSQPDAL